MAKRLLAIVLGASAFPDAATLTADEAFLHSARVVGRLLLSRSGLHIDLADVLWLFDDDREASLQVSRAREWLEERVNDSGPFGDENPTALLVYYVGHGDAKNNTLYLAVRATQGGAIEASSIPVGSLARLLKDHAGSLKKFVILDCCFAGVALSAFQIRDRGGLTLMCSSDRTSTAEKADDNSFTVFTNALIQVLTTGDPDRAALLSLSDIRRLVAKRQVSPRHQPQLHDPGTPPSGDLLSEEGLFPNLARKLNGATAELEDELYSRLLEMRRRLGANTRAQLEEMGAATLDAAKRALEGHAASFAERLVELQADMERRSRLRAATYLAVGLALVLFPAAIAAWRGVSWAQEVADDHTVSISPALGWQAVRSVAAGDRLCLTADGRVHLGTNQVVNLMNAAKPLIVRSATENEPDLLALREAFPWKADYETTVFRRTWTGPEGETVRDEMLDEALLEPTCKWGMLLATVLPETVSVTALANSDPLKAVVDSRDGFAGVKCVGSKSEYTAPTSGRLAFIVNDAVVSTVPSAARGDRSAELDRALRAASKTLRERQEIDPRTLPLFWYADNGGVINVRVTRGACQK